WFPPEKAEVGSAPSGGRISYSFAWRRKLDATASPRRRHRPLKVFSSWYPRIALSRPEKGMTSPIRWRSSGTWQSPSQRIRRGEWGGAGCPPPADLAGLRRPDARQRLEELRLAVAGDAGDPHDLAAPDREADALDALDSEPVLDHEVGDLEDRLARVRRGLVD